MNLALKNSGFTKRQGSMLSSAAGNCSTGQSPNFPSDPKSPIEVDNREAASPSGATTTASAVKYGLDHSTDESKAAELTALRIFARCHQITGWNSRTQLTNKIIAWAIEHHLYDPEMDNEHQALRLDPPATQTDDPMGQQEDVGNTATDSFGVDPSVDNPVKAAVEPEEEDGSVDSTSIASQENVDNTTPSPYMVDGSVDIPDELDLEDEPRDVSNTARQGSINNRAISPHAPDTCDASLIITIEDSDEEMEPEPPKQLSGGAETSKKSSLRPHHHLQGMENITNHGNKPSNHSPARVSSRKKRKTQAEGITTWADPEYQEAVATELALTWQRVEITWVNLRPWRMQIEGTDDQLDGALTQFKEIIRGMIGEAEDKGRINSRDASKLSIIWRKIEEKRLEVEGVNGGEEEEEEEEEDDLRSFSQTLHELAGQAALYDCILAFPDPIVRTKRRKRMGRQA